MPMDHMHPEFSRGYAYVEFSSAQAASDAVNYMNGGQLDGQEVSVTEVMPRVLRHSSPPTHRDRHRSPGRISDQRLVRLPFANLLPSNNNLRFRQ
ncbi:unnamed protein product [Schistocephalus solidus]|uniref:RRM domain-containing protein n=1 Tax=Schistocephalus solidus TaxID=70667 RepID=A0A183T450_SCHSO|nr:unnamed protein product [Schistocephalus solidus]